MSPGAVGFPVVSNALTKTRALPAVVVELARIEAGLPLTNAGDISAPIVTLLGDRVLKIIFVCFVGLKTKK